MIAQWLAWRLRFPSIILLLIIGFLAGPVFHWIHPHQLFGDGLFAFVSAAVAIILFEGGLSLNYKELTQAGRPVIGLVTLGIFVTGVLASFGARFIFGWPWHLAALLGAILTVTGPTVIQPMLQVIRPSGAVGPILKWEGTLTDPIGAVLAVLVYDVSLLGEYSNAFPYIAIEFLQTLGVGAIIGALGALFLMVVIKYYWVPDFLENPLALVTVVGTLAVANHLQPESGLLAVTLMGVILANQRWAPMQKVVEFKENLRVLMLSLLFILLAARVELPKLVDIRWEAFLYLGWLLFLVRPASVWASTLGTGLSNKEKFFLSWMAPRGVVAAAVSSIFVLQLVRHGHAHAEPLDGVVFFIIVSLALVYGITAPRLARKLGLAEETPQGVLFVGAHPLVQQMARAIQEEGLKVLLVDTNRDNVRESRMLGLPAENVSIMSDTEQDQLDLDGLGYLVALTSNDGINALAAIRYRNVFSRARVFQLVPGRPESQKSQPIADEFSARHLFTAEANYSYLVTRFDAGWTIKKTPITQEFNYEQWLKQYPGAVPLFAISQNRTLRIITPKEKWQPASGHLLIALVPNITAG